MNRYVAASVCAVLGLGLVWGCDEGEPAMALGGPSPTEVAADVTEEVAGGVDSPDWRIVGSNKQTATGRVEVQFEIDGEPHTWVTKPLENGREFELVDASGDRFGVSVGHDGERFLLSEWTDTDRLDVEVQEFRGGRVAETYRLNGNEQTWVFRAGAELPRGAADEFRSFMPETSSLNHNVVGDRLAALMTDPFLVEEIEELGLGRDVTGLAEDVLKFPRWIDYSCWGFETCAALKCTFGGGLANSVCVFCVGASIMCKFLRLL